MQTRDRSEKNRFTSPLSMLHFKPRITLSLTNHTNHLTRTAEANLIFEQLHEHDAAGMLHAMAGCFQLFELGGAILKFMREGGRREEEQN